MINTKETRRDGVYHSVKMNGNSCGVCFERISLPRQTTNRYRTVPQLLAMLMACLVASADAWGATVIWIDFGSFATAPTTSNWNSGVTIAGAPNLVDSTGVSTGIGIQVTGDFSNGTTDNGATSGWQSWVDNNAPRDGLSFPTSSSLKLGTMTFTGLASNARYTFDVIAARNSAPSGDNRLANYTIGSTTYTDSNAFDNWNNKTVLVFNEVSPVSDGNGGWKIDFVVATTGSSRFGYVNAVRITAVPEPSTWALAGLGILGVTWIARRRGSRR